MQFLKATDVERAREHGKNYEPYLIVLIVCLQLVVGVGISMLLYRWKRRGLLPLFVLVP